MMKELKAFFQKMGERIFSFFYPYEIQWIDGHDVENLIQGDRQQTMTLLDANHDRLEQIRPEYENCLRQMKFMEKFVDVYEREELTTLAYQYAKIRAVLQESDYEQELEEKPNVALNRFRGWEADVPAALELMEEHELEQQKVKNDLSHLQGEKDALAYYYRRYKGGVAFTRMTLIVTAILAVVGSIGFYYWRASRQEDVFLSVVAFILVIAFVGTWAYIFRRNFQVALEQNKKKQKRAIELINKTKIKYVRYQQLLDYEYTKYDVASSEVLRLRFEHYQAAKSKRQKRENLHRREMLLVNDIKSLLNKTSLGEQNLRFFLKQADLFSSSKGQKKLLTLIVKKRKELQDNLAVLEREHDFLERLAE